MFSQADISLSVGTADCDMSDVLSECSDTSYISDISDLEEEFHSLNIDISNGPTININNFKIVQYNINSILATDRLE